MDMRALLEKMMKFAGADQKSGPAGQLRGSEKMPKKGSKQHPAYHKLVGDSIEPQENMLSDLSKQAKKQGLEWQLAEEYREFLEAEFKDVADKRPARKGSREEKFGKRGHKAQPRYKTIKEAVMGDSEESNAVVAEVIKLISDGHTEVAPDVIIAKVSAALGRPFMLKDLVSANNSSPELQHYIDSINPTKIKFSTDILTVKNQDPMKEKEQAQDGVAKMAARAANRSRLGESDQGISKSAETKFHKKLDTLVHDTFGRRKDEMEESAQPREKVGRIIRRVLGDKLVWNPDYSVLYKNTRYSKTQRVDYYAMKSIKVLASRDELPELGSMLKAELEKAGYPVYKFSIGPLQISFQTRSPVQISEPSEGINENAEELNVGDDVVITGPVEHQGETGIIDSFGQDNRFVVVNLYNHGKKSFHSSDVSYNDYADSDAEEAEMYDRNPEFRDWAARQEVDEGWGAEPAAARHREQMTAVAQVLQKYKNDPVKSKIANYLFVNNWGAQAIEKELADPNAQQKFQANIDKYEQQVGPVKDWSDSMAADYLQTPTAESRGHKILARKLADIERSKKPSAPVNDKSRAEQVKAEYQRYVEKMKKLNPNYVPLYKMDEYGANQPTGTAAPGQAQAINDPLKAKNIQQATQALKSATGSSAPATNIAKALDAASQGTGVSSTDMKVLEPLMKDISTVAQDPKLANQFKTLAQQVNQTQKQQQQQAIKKQ